MKFNNVFYSYTIILLIFSFHTQCTEETSKRPWCWTKSMANEPSFVLNKELGGINWGYCKMDSVASPQVYTAFVSTSQIEKSETNSLIKIQIFGNKGQTEETVLTSDGFERGSERKITFEGDDIGNVEKIALRVSGATGYRCKNIVIQKGNKSTNFQCLKRIEPCKPGDDPKDCVLEMEADGETPYEVLIKTSEEADAGTNSPLFISLSGTKGESRKKILSELGFKKGASTLQMLEKLLVSNYTLVLMESGSLFSLQSKI